MKRANNGGLKAPMGRSVGPDPIRSNLPANLDRCPHPGSASCAALGRANDAPEITDAERSGPAVGGADAKVDITEGRRPLGRGRDCGEETCAGQEGGRGRRRSRRMPAGGGSGQGNARERLSCASFVAVPSS
ncbi:hypothetical protein EYF80_060815 [Liparis tanakae]|uniref:Uncharacterized protein n=1 Tax=Liparis tanakae TaxID=230148 RepID=A0A4Z2EJB1_9TELE|nr:hypothetical protein EYF80_060815 [Liparis tanakae]